MRPRSDPKPQDDLIFVGEAHGTGPIGLAICQLESLGIAVFARHYHMAVVCGHWSTGLGGAQLWVPRARAQEALEALDAMTPLRSSLFGSSWVLAWFLFSVMVSIPLAPRPAALYPRSKIVRAR